MSETSQFPLPPLARRNTSASEAEAMLDLLPFPALLVDAGSLAILGANSGASELTGFTRTEMQGATMSGLFTCMDGAPLDKGVLQEQRSLKVNRQGGKKIDLQSAPTSLPPKGRHILFKLEEVSTLLRRREEERRKVHFWEDLCSLSTSIQGPDFRNALERALQAGQALTDAGHLVVYQAAAGAPEMRRVAVWGSARSLPEELLSQDLAALQKPHLWTAGRRQISDLHRAANANQLSYLASAPLGQPDASIGLLVIADQIAAPPTDILSIAKLLSAVITSILQQYALSFQLGQRLQEQSRVLRFNEGLLNSVQEGVLLLSPTLQILRLNPAAEKMLGYSNREVANQPVQKILIGGESVLQTLFEAQQGGSGDSMEDIRLYRRHGEAFLARIQALPVLGSSALEGILVLLQDLSEQEAIRDQTQQLEQRAMLGEVTAVFAHEVRNPINNISTGLQLLALNLPERDPNQEMLGRLQTDCDRLAELMKSVLQFSRPTDYDMELVDLGMFFQRMLERQRPRMERAAVQYGLQLDPDCPPVRANVRALEQVFNNLINNAVQAMSEGGSLAIKVQHVVGAPDSKRRGKATDTKILSNQKASLERRAYVAVSIADTGPGIPREAQERIFQPFFTTKSNGTGLGLAITKRIITAHKGNIRLESFPGGTIFHVELPAPES